MVEQKWVSHLKDSIPEEAYGYPVSMYSIALEGWRRGLELRFENNNRVKSVIRYSLSDGKKTHYFTGSQGDLVSREAIRICSNKALTKEYLSKAEVTIAEGKVFDKKATDEDIIHYVEEIGYPVVIKPVRGAGGRGVIADIRDKISFLQALKYVKNELGHEQIIVEKHIEGEDYRVYVVGDKVIGAINRIPANVIGDGKKTISQLLKEKNKEKKNNPAITDSPIRKDSEMLAQLKKYGYTLDSVPLKGERIFLKTKSNISAGGEPVDATEKLSEEVKENAIKAVKAIPGLNHGGVDILWDSSSNNMAVLEVNTIASIRSHLFPLEGKARDVPKAIVDFYFPDTKANHEYPFYYFEIEDILKGFTNNRLMEVSIPNHPKGDLVSKRIIIDNVQKPLAFTRKKFKVAKNLQLNGYIQNVGKKTVEIIVSGPKEKVHKFENKLNEESEAEDIHVFEWNKPVKIGFERIRNNTVSKNENVEDLTIIKKESLRLKKERDFYKEKYEKVVNSKVWRLANIIRKFMKRKKR